MFFKKVPHHAKFTVAADSYQRQTSFDICERSEAAVVAQSYLEVKGPILCKFHYTNVFEQ